MNFPDDCPPGTEGYEDLQNFSKNADEDRAPKGASTSFQNDDKKYKIYKFLQSHKIQLDDGTSHRALDFIEKKDASAYICYPCGTTCLNELTLQDHLNGKKHANKLSSKKVWPASIINTHPFNMGASKPSVVEVVEVAKLEQPIEYVEETLRSQLWHRLQDYKQSPVIGLEYLIELLCDNSPTVYFCSLCEKRGDCHTIVNHIVGLKHKIKFLSMHYPTAYRAMLTFLKQSDKYHKGTMQVVHNICNCIEQAYGRLPPLIIARQEFELNRFKYMKKCSESPHFSERDGGTFEDLVDEEYITLLSESGSGTKGPVNIGEMIDLIEPSPPKVVKHVVNVKDKIKISIKSTSLDNVKISEEKDLRENLNEIKARKGETSIPSRNQLLGGNKNEDTYLESVSPPSDYLSVDVTNRLQGIRDRVRGRTSPAPFRKFPSREMSFRDRRRSVSRERKRPTRRSRTPKRSRSPKRSWSPKRSRSPRSRSPKRSRSPRRFRMEPFEPRGRGRFRGAYRGGQRRSRSPHTSPYREPDQDKNIDNSNCTAFGRKMIYKLDLLKSKMTENLEMRQKTLAYHEKNPEKHPLYQEEWKKYWNRRYKELKSENADVTQFDFKPEWIVFWGKRMQEIHDADIEGLKLELCRLLNLPTSEPEFSRNFDFMHDPVGQKSPVPKPERLRNASPPVSEQANLKSERDNYQKTRSKDTGERFGNDHHFNKDSDWKRDFRTSPEKRKPSRNIKERRMPLENQDSDFSPWDDDGSVNSIIFVSDSKRSHSKSQDSKRLKNVPERGREIISKDRDRSYGRSSKMQSKKDVSDSSVGTFDINVISILRLLTALENYLGSLGPKVIDLLALALKMEKNKANSSDDILIDDTYNVLFETVKEKLKGQLLAGLVESNAVQATKTAIQNIASLLHKANQLAQTRKLMLEEEKKKSKSLPVTVEGIGAVEKAAIARQIAAALIAQGKTNVTTQELEALVNAVVGMAKASTTSQQPATTAGFLAQLESDKSNNKIAEQSAIKAKEMEKESSSNALQLLQSAYTQKNIPVSPKPQENCDETISGMEGLSDSDLKTLLQNFKDLSSDEQHGLIAYLKKLELKDPKRVEKLRKFVDLKAVGTDSLDVRETSPFSSRECGNNPEDEKINQQPDALKKIESKCKESDDEDDYTFDEVFKSASEKVKEKQLQEELAIVSKTLQETSSGDGTVLDTKSIISNIMGSLKQGPVNVNMEPTKTADQVAVTNAQNIAKVLSLIESMAGQKGTNNFTQSTTTSMPVQPPPGSFVPQPEPFHAQNQSAHVESYANLPVQNQLYNPMQFGHSSTGNAQGDGIYPQLMSTDTKPIGFQNKMSSGNQNNFDNNFSGGRPLPDGTMNYSNNEAFANFRNLPASNTFGKQYPHEMRNTFRDVTDVGTDQDYYQNAYSQGHDWNNPQQRMPINSQYIDGQRNHMISEQGYYDTTSNYDEYQQNNNYRGQDRHFGQNPNRGMMGARGGNIRGGWRGGYMRN